MLDATAGGIDDLGRRNPSGIVRHRPRVDARHLQNVLKETREPIDFGDDQLALFAALLFIRPRRLQVIGGDANGRQWRAQVMAERRQERGLQLFALTRELGALPLVEKLHSLDRDRGQPGERVERAGFHRSACGGEQTDRLRPEPERHDADVVPGLCHDACPARDGALESDAPVARPRR